MGMLSGVKPLMIDRSETALIAMFLKCHCIGKQFPQLTERVDATTDVHLSALDLLLLRCGKSCKAFEEENVICSSLETWLI
jgi:hypothetical protein